MEFLGVISTIMDLTQKEGEFSDEVNAISMTFMSLQMAVSELGENELPQHLREMIRSLLNETQDLIKKTTGTKNWWKNIKYLLPGSDLHKLKEKNGQLLHAINLINLHVNSIKGANLRKMVSKGSGNLEDLDDLETAKKLKKDRSILSISSTIQDPVEESKAISATIQDTQLEGDEDENKQEPSFRLVFIYDKKTYEQCEDSSEKLIKVETQWENDVAEYSIEREALMYLPELICGRLSKSHAEIKAQRGQEKERTEDLAIKATLQDDEDNGNDANNSDNENNSFEILDKSTNGTFILKNHSYGQITGPVAAISGDFKNIKKGNKISLKSLDIVGLVMNKPSLKEVLFGFQFISEGVSRN